MKRFALCADKSLTINAICRNALTIDHNAANRCAFRAIVAAAEGIVCAMTLKSENSSSTISPSPLPQTLSSPVSISSISLPSSNSFRYFDMPCSSSSSHKPHEQLKQSTFSNCSDARASKSYDLPSLPTCLLLLIVRFISFVLTLPPPNNHPKSGLTALQAT